MFLFKDINFITVSKDIRTSPRVKFSKEFQQNIIRIKKFEESDHENNENSYSIYTMLSEIESFLKYFRKFVLSWASSYQVQENNKKKPLDTQFTIDNAISTILSRLRLTQEQQELILNDICARSKRGKGLLDDISYYQEGFEYYEFNDTPNNNDVTQLKYIKVNDTAEKVLLELANSAQVFGISATAEINTPVGNYNLDYIKNELKDKYHATPKWLKDEMKAELDDVFRPYKEGKIKVHVNKYKCKLEPFDVAEYCSEWIKNKFSTIEARVRNAVVEEVEIMLQDIPHQKQYIAIRYCNLFLTMCNFWQHNDIKSYLYLGMRLPKTEEKEFDIKIVNALYYQAALLAGRNKKDKVVVLGSKKFDEDKERLLERLSKGEKIFVISTYQSIGAGQNLQYKVSDNSPYVKLTNKNRNSVDYSSKDFDGIYLADTTHLTVNTQQEEKLSDEQLLNLLVQIQEVYNVGQISALIKDKCIRDAFRKYSGIKDKINNDLQDKRAITIQATRIVLQAVGRLCRTYVKNPDIYIDIEDTLLKKLYTFEIEKRILPPEMEAILKHCDQHYNNEDEEVLNNAERASTVAGRFISTYTDPIRWEIGWTPTQIDKWKRLRECVLKYPTADVKIFEQEDAVRRYYFRVKDKTNNYLFAQHSEFSYVNISLDNNIIEFEDRVNNQHKDKGYQGHAIIQKMNEQESGLLDMLKYDGLREYFKSKGYATTFTNNYYLMCPIIYSNIYKGALGEVVGEFILKQELNIELSFIDNPLLFELFDFKLSEGVYVDFKHWGLNMHRDNKSMLQHISDKLDKMNATRVYIINILKRGEFEVDNTADERIVQIPWLIDEKGAINIDALNSIKKEDYCYVNK